MQQSGGSHGRWGEDGDEQVTDLRDGQPDRVVAAGGMLRIGRPGGVRVGGEGGQEGQGQHGERDVPVP